MKQFFKTISVCFSIFFASHAMTQTHPGMLWAKSMGGTNSEYAQSLAVDAAGNAYITGTFWGTADFDPGPGVYTLTALNSGGDVFISKLDANGNFVWAKAIGSNQQDEGNAITLDPAGNILVCGMFRDTADFDPGPAVFKLTPFGLREAFVLKLDAGGTFIWAKQFGGAPLTINCIANGIKADASGNIYTVGAFAGTVDFDPGSSTISSLSSTAADKNVFVSKLDAAGNFVWAKKFGSSVQGDYGEGNAIVLDGSGNVYTTGVFEGTLDFDPNGGAFPMSSIANTPDVFISKLDPSGNFIWAKAIGSSANEFAHCIASDAAGDIYVGGDFESTMDFDPGSGVFNLTAFALTPDAFILKLNASGNFQWARAIGNANGDYLLSIAVDSANGIYTTGYYGATVDLDPGPGIDNVSSNGLADVFISKLTASGNYIWGMSLGGHGWEQGMSIATDASGNIYTAGYFNDTVTCIIGDIAAIPVDLIAKGIEDVFINKIHNDGSVVSINQASREKGVSVSPNPVNDILNLNIKEETSGLFLEICNTLGQVIFSRRLETGKAQLNMNQVPPGLYFLKLTEGSQVIFFQKLLKD